MPHPWKATFLDLQRQVDELFDELIYRRWSIAGPREWRPPLDLHETPEAYLVEIDLPDVTPAEVRILVNAHNLRITGQRRASVPEDAVFNRCERNCGRFDRSVDFPQPVEPEKVQAECRHGTYRIRLPKKLLPEETGEPSTLSVEGTQYIIQVEVR